MRVMSAGDGYKYLLRSVAAADGDRSLSTPLTRYYMEEGTPQGRKSSNALIGWSGQLRSSCLITGSGASRQELVEKRGEAFR